MDLILTHPPHLITIACIYVASVYKERDIKTWFEELSADMNIVSFCQLQIFGDKVFVLIIHWFVL